MVSRSALARGMRLEATPRACGLRLLTVLAATKLLQWKKCFRGSFEKNASMRESGGEEGSFANLLPTQLFHNLLWKCCDLRIWRIGRIPRTAQTAVGKKAEVQVRSRSTWRRSGRSRGPPVSQLFKIWDNDPAEIRQLSQCTLLRQWFCHANIRVTGSTSVNVARHRRAGTPFRKIHFSIVFQKWTSLFSNLWTKLSFSKILKIISENYFWKWCLEIISEHNF